MAIDVAISNNFAFGGANACLAFARPGTHAAPPPPDFDRVVITGIATLTSAGNDPDTVLAAFEGGQVTTADENGAAIGRVQFDPSEFLSPRDRRRMDRLSVFAVVAAQIAIRDAGITPTDENRERIGVIFGTGTGPMEAMEEFSRPLLEEGPAAANPAIFPNTVYNAAGGQVAMRVGAIGPASTVTAGHGAGASALCYSVDLVASGKADAIICLGVDTLTPMVIRGYRELGVLSTGEGGFALAEAGIGLVVERLSVAQARGARIYAEVLGYGITSDAIGVGRLDPRGRGLARAMTLALETSGVTPDDVSAVWTSSAGLAVVDKAESLAVRRVFDQSPAAPTILSPKKQFGEPMGAGAPLCVALALTSWQKADPKDRPGPILVNSCSLGGTNFSIAVAPWGS